MSGSSKSLVRSLGAVFGSWSGAELQDVRELFAVIHAYNERHNSAATIKASVNEELRAAYATHIQQCPNVEKERLFLDVLARLLPLLELAHVKLWLAAYLKPALDSAGYDLEFVEKARAFVKAVTVGRLPTADAELALRRTEIAHHVAGDVLRVYLGSEAAYALISVDPLSALSSQAHVERVRFIESNALVLLTEMAAHDAAAVFALLDTHFALARLKCITFLSLLFSSSSSRFVAIVETLLCTSLLRCLILDSDETVVTACLATLVMLLPKVCHRIGPFVPDLFLIFSRLLHWQHVGSWSAQKQLQIAEILQRSLVEWLFASSTWLDSGIVHSHLFTDGEFDLLYFAALLYGLFPCNLTLLLKSPWQYWLKNETRCVSSEVLVFYRDELRIHNPQQLKCLAFGLLRGFRLHPNFVNMVTLEEERRNPIEWMAKEDDELSEESVLLACLSLNAANEARSQTWSTPPASRKMSIIPTNLVLDAPKRFSRHSSEVHFNKIDFGRGKRDDEKEAVLDLFSSHEMLFTMNNSRKSSIIPRVPSVSHSIAPDSEEEPKTEEEAKSGTALDFYKRELLLLKNESEFASYIKHLNKSNYARLKVKMIKAQRAEDGEDWRLKYKDLKKRHDDAMETIRSTEEQKNADALQLKLTITAIVDQLASVQQELKECKATNAMKNEAHSKLFEDVEKSRQALLAKEAEIQDLKHELTILKEGTKPPQLPVQSTIQVADIDATPKEVEVFVLKDEVSSLTLENEKLKDKIKAISEQLASTLKLHEADLQSLRADMGKSVRGQVAHHERRVQELSLVVARFEAALAEKNARLLQMSSSQPIRIPGAETPAPSQYKGHFSRSQRSPEIGAPDLRNGRLMQDYFENRDKSDVRTSPSVLGESLVLFGNRPVKPPLPKSGSKLSISSQVPIVKGRGGYQKRAKRIM